MRTAGVLVFISLLMGTNHGSGAESAFNEPQVKALFLYNFAKYVEWPANAFAEASSPIIIGLVGGEKIEEELRRIVEGKSVDGHPILVRQNTGSQDLNACHILFIGVSEKNGLIDIVTRIKSKPVLTVGEFDQFMENGGVINFVKKEGKVHLKINLEAARRANVRISSKLLNVADEVKGK